MTRILLELSLAIALTMSAILTSVSGARANELSVSAAFARASATPMAKSGAVYVSIINGGTGADRLLSVSTPAARSAELHTTVMAEDVMQMEEAGEVEVAAGGTLEMKPGGLHVMLMGLTSPLKQGESIEMNFRFEKAGEIIVTVPVGGVAEGSP